MNNDPLVDYLDKIIKEQPSQSGDTGEAPEFQIAKSTKMEDLLDKDGKVREV